MSWTPTLGIDREKEGLKNGVPLATCHLATDTPSDVERLDEFLEYLVTVGFADERHELR